MALYEVTNIPGVFVALNLTEDVDDTGQTWVTFHDTTRQRVVRKERIRYRPMTLARWNADARRKFNPKAPRFGTLAALEAALTAAAGKLA